jgi:hypothetical protein
MAVVAPHEKVIYSRALSQSKVAVYISATARMNSPTVDLAFDLTVNLTVNLTASPTATRTATSTPTATSNQGNQRAQP